MKSFRIAALFGLAVITAALTSAPVHAQRLTEASAPSSSLSAKTGAKKQEPLTGFSGVQWGDTLELAQKILHSKGAAASKIAGTDNNAKEMNAKNVLWATNLKVADFTKMNAVLRFGNEGFYQADVLFTPLQARDATKVYNEVRLIVSERFGTPMTDRPLTEFAAGGGVGFDYPITSEWIFDRPKQEPARLKLTIETIQGITRTTLQYRAIDRADREEGRIRSEKAKSL